MLGQLAAGGTGIVLVAYDPALARKVALKLLPLAAGAATGALPIEREARAMARLAHPNVVTVFEVDRIAGQAYVAMELVEGATLRGWIAERPRPWREIVRMFVTAGRGLEAAHAAGLVHRDFKPENVLIGRDGRPRICDFGLVGPRVGDPAAEPDLRGDLTTRESIEGTPAYMSPEQWAGRPIDVRGDQFAFCVALWEALWRQRPFAGATAHELRTAVLSGAIAEPAERCGVPRRLRAVLRRGLAVDPAARWPGMTMLLDVLARANRIRRRWVIAMSSAAAAVVSAVAVATLVRGLAAPAPCPIPHLARVWDLPRQIAVQAAFEATGVGYARDTSRRVHSMIDTYVAGWTGMLDETCHARLERRVPETVVELRMRCLDQRRSELGALTALWAGGVDATMLEHAIAAARGLTPLAECADVAALSARPSLPADPVRAGAITAARFRVETVQALTRAHRWLEARPLAASVRIEADATGWPALRAQAAFAAGEVLARVADAGAEPALLDAVRLAGAAHDDRLVARALIELVSCVAENEQQAARALTLAQIADGAIARAGDDDELRGKMLLARGDALLTSGAFDAAQNSYLEARAHWSKARGSGDTQVRLIAGDLARVADGMGDYARAVELTREALAAAISELGPEHPQVANALNNLGMFSDLAGDRDAATDYYRRALDVKRKNLGSGAASTALTMNNLGIVVLANGDLDEAQALLEGALEIRERVLGPEHGYVATTLSNLAGLRRKQGRFAEAVAMLERALEIKIKAYGEHHASVAYALAAMAEIPRVQGQHGAALAWFERALELRRRALGQDHPATAESMVQVGAELAALGRCGEARPLLATARARLARAGQSRVLLAEALSAGATCDLAIGKIAQAVAGFEHALALGEQAKGDVVARGSTRWRLSRALWVAGQHAAAIAAAQVAERELAKDADGAHELAATRAWLTAHIR